MSSSSPEALNSKPNIFIRFSHIVNYTLIYIKFVYLVLYSPLHFGYPNMIFLSEIIIPLVDAFEIGFYRVPVLFILKCQSRFSDDRSKFCFFSSESRDVDHRRGSFTPWWPGLAHNSLHQVVHLLDGFSQSIVPPGQVPVWDQPHDDLGLTKFHHQDMLLLAS